MLVVTGKLGPLFKAMTENASICWWLKSCANFYRRHKKAGYNQPLYLKNRYGVMPDSTISPNAQG
jgi:hypothetical protein